MFAALSLMGILIPNTIGLSTSAPAAATRAARPVNTFSNLSPAQALSFQKTNQIGFGYITKLSIGAPVVTTLKIDLPRTNPTTGITTAANSAAALGYFSWSGGMADPLSLKCDVSQFNRSLLQVSGNVGTKVPVQLSLVIYYFDQATQQWFTTIGNSAPVALTGFTSNLAVAAMPSSDVTSPTVYQISLSVSPNPTTQQIPCSFAPGPVTMKPW